MFMGHEWLPFSDDWRLKRAVAIQVLALSIQRVFHRYGRMEGGHPGASRFVGVRR